MLEVSIMETIKQEAMRVISTLPDDASLDDIMYNLYVVDKVRKGKNDIRNGNYRSSEALKKEIEKW